MSNYQLLEISNQSESISFEKNQLKSCDYQNRFNRLLRYEDSQRLVNINGEQESDLNTMINRAVELNPYGQVIDYQLKQDLVPTQYTQASNHFADSLTLDEKINIGHESISKISKKFSNLAVDMKITACKRLVSLSTSSGSKVTFPMNNFSISSLITGCEEEDILFVASELNEPVSSFENINSYIEELIENLEKSSNMISIEPGTYPVIFHPQLVHSGLLSVIHAGMNPTNLENKSSPLLDKVGEQILHKSINLFQHGSHFPIDFNGYPSDSSSVIANGQLCHLPVPPQISKCLARSSNGSSFDGSWFSDLTLTGGTREFKQLLQDIDRGILVLMSGDMIMGNILQGDLSGTIQFGFLVEDGQILGRIKDRSLGFNFYNSLTHNLIGFSKELRRFGCTQYVKVPYICIDGVRIS